MSQIRYVNTDGTIAVTEPEKELVSNHSVSAPVTAGIERQAIEEVMGLEDDLSKQRYEAELDGLLIWAKTKTQDHSPEALKSAIRELEIRLGSTPLAEKKIHYLSRYAYLEMESQKLSKEMESIAGK